MCFSAALLAQDNTVWEDQQALLLSNGTLEPTVLPHGGAMSQLVLTDDREQISLYGTRTAWLARED